MRWDVDLAAAGEMGLYDSLQGLYPDMHREFAAYMKDAYPGVAQEPRGKSSAALDRHRRRVPAADSGARQGGGIHRRRLSAPRSVARSRAAARAVLRRRDDALLTPCSRRRRRTRATRCSADSFPGEIAARFPDWWGNADREDESLNAHERELLEAHLEELCGPDAGSLSEDLDRRATPTSSSVTWAPRSAARA